MYYIICMDTYTERDTESKGKITNICIHIFYFYILYVGKVCGISILCGIFIYVNIDIQYNTIN